MVVGCWEDLAMRSIPGLAVFGHDRLMDKPRSPEVEAFWEAFRRARGVAEEDYCVCCFGSGPELADELLELVLKGAKRATAYLLRDVEQGGEKMSVVGGHVVVV